MKASDFDRKFDAGKEEVISDLDLSSAVRPDQTARQVTIELPLWMIESLDREAARLNLTRQSIIKMWLAEKLESVQTS